MFVDNFEQVEIDVPGVRLPSVSITPKDYKKYGCESNISNTDFLKQLCNHGFKEKLDSGLIDKKRKKEYIDRIRRELDVLEKTGFIEYILLVWKVVHQAEDMGVVVGNGRGSAAGSVILYLIGATKVDSVKYGLIFERFMSEARAKTYEIDGVKYADYKLLPDIDTDFDPQGRKKIIEWLNQEYQGKFAKLCTLQTYKSKIALKEAGKIIGGFTEEQMNYYTKQIPVVYGKPFRLEKAAEGIEVLGNFAKKNPEVFQCAKNIEGCINAKGTHASAYIVSYHPLNEHTPTETNADGEIVSSYDMDSAQRLSIKLDLLGLDALQLVDKCVKSTGISLEEIDVNSYDLIYKHLQNLKLPYGLFQISASTAFGATNDIKPTNIHELSDVSAIARPGALDYLDEYVSVKNGGETEKRHPVLDEILDSTKGIAVYQESLMKIAHEVFGFGLDDAEAIRRCCSKKLPEEMKQWESKIYEQAEKKNIDKSIADYYWGILQASANYSFCEAHSTSYSVLTAYTVFFKFNYPNQFYLACCELAKKQDDIEAIKFELDLVGIRLLPPDIVKSGFDFQLEDGGIRFGLKNIKGVSDKAYDHIHSFVKEIAGNNKFEVFDAAKKAKVNIGILSSLIQAGALSDLSDDRPKLVLEAQLWYILTDKERTYCLKHGEKYSYNLFKMSKDITEWVDTKGNRVVRDSRINTLRSRFKKYKEIYELNKRYPLFCAYVYEKELLGYSYSINLKEVFCEEHPNLTAINELPNLLDNQRVEVVGEIRFAKKDISKAKGNRYLKVELSDGTGLIDVMFMNEARDIFLDNNKGNLPKEGDIVYARGRIGDKPDIIWGDFMSVQSYKIYMKLSQLGKSKAET